MTVPRLKRTLDALLTTYDQRYGAEAAYDVYSEFCMIAYSLVHEREARTFTVQLSDHRVKPSDLLYRRR